MIAREMPPPRGRRGGPGGGGGRNRVSKGIMVLAGSAVIFYVATLIYITGEQISEVKQAGSSRASSIRGGGEGASSSPAAAAADVGKEERMKTAGGAGSPALGNKPVSGAEDTKGGMCRGVTGSEEGYWTTDGSGFRYNIKGCKLKRFDRDMARKCLRNRHLLFVGDSVTRFQYTAFVHLVLKGYPEPTGNKGFCIAKGGWGEFFWRTFFLKSSELLEGRELCDCYRPNKLSGAAAKRGTTENRHFGMAEYNLSVSYLPLLNPSWGVKGFWPGECRNASTSPELRCSDANMTKRALIEAAHILTEEEFDVTLPSLPFQWSGGLADVFRRVVKHMEVDTLVLNSGLWGTLTDEQVVNDWFKAASDVICREGSGGMCLWKRTTMQFVCQKGGNKCPASEQTQKLTDDALATRLLKKYAGWGVYDSAQPTSLLHVSDMVDAKHFKPYVSNELNNLLLNVICPAS